MTLNASGNLLLGTTTSYNSRLVIIPASNPTSSTGADNQISIGEASQNNAYSLKIGYIFTGGGYQGSIQSIAGGSGGPLFLNASGGNVTIGTTTDAGYKLDVNGTGRFSDYVQLNSSTYSRLDMYGANGYGNQIRFGDGTTLKAAIRQNYNVGEGLEFYSGGIALANLALYINTSGNVSIGNTNNTYKLDVSGTGRFTGQLNSITGVFGSKGGGSYGVLISDNDQSNVRLRFTNTGGPNTWDLVGGLNAQNNNDFSIYDATNGINALRIVPVTGAATFNSSVTASGFYSVYGNSARFYRNTNDAYWQINNDSNNFLNFGTYLANGTAYGTNPKMILLDNGNVGIGTTAPTEKLDVIGGALAAGNGTIRTGITYSSLGLIGTFTNHDLGIITNGSEKMRITSGGDLAIGTTTPAYRLEVYNSTADDHIAAVGSGPSLQLMSANTGPANWATIAMATATNQFITGALAGDLLMSNRGSTAGNILFGFGSSEKMRITSAGNVLINTTSSTSGYPLEVEAGSGGIQLYLKRSGANAEIFMGGTTGASTQLFIRANGSNGVYLNAGGNAWVANSDERLKTDLVPIEDAANKVSSLRSVIGRYKTDEEGTKRPFLIAQDVLKVLPEAVNKNEETGDLGVSYTEIIPLLVAAIKEQQAQIEELKQLIKNK
jgi:hypothetical protein